jgi:hypothetical protein
MGTYKQQHADAQRAQRSVKVCLRNDLVADWEAADRELTRVQAERLATDSKEAGAGTAELADKVRALEALMNEQADEWLLRAMPRHQFRALMAAHPPRKGEDGEPVEGDRVFNRATFFPALIRASVVSPELDDEDWAWLLGDDEAEDGVLTDRQFSDLEDAAWFLNRGEVDVPFSLAASQTAQASGGE